MTKPTHCFYTTFKNIPYTDEEWERANAHRAKLAESKWYQERHPEECTAFETRPCHDFRYGPTVYSHDQARKECEKAILERKAQMVEYSVWGPKGSVERWSLQKGREWRQEKFLT